MRPRSDATQDVSMTIASCALLGPWIGYVLLLIRRCSTFLKRPFAVVMTSFRPACQAVSQELGHPSSGGAPAARPPLPQALPRLREDRPSHPIARPPFHDRFAGLAGFDLIRPSPARASGAARCSRVGGKSSGGYGNGETEPAAPGAGRGGGCPLVCRDDSGDRLPHQGTGPCRG